MMLLTVWLVILALNLLPAFIAYGRGQYSAGAILATILIIDMVLVGAFIFGAGLLSILAVPAWFVMLIWSFAGNTEARDHARARLHADAMVEAMLAKRTDAPTIQSRREKNGSWTFVRMLLAP